MRLRIVSDLHFEFHADGGAALAAEIASGPPFDVLVVAGDLATLHGLSAALDRLGHVAPSVVYVSGNHEAYGASLAALAAARRGDWAQLRWLECSSIEVGGCRRRPRQPWTPTPTSATARRILGAALWFPRAPRVHKDGMMDFRVIRDAEPAIYEANARAVEFLRQELREGDVVVTHHLPSFRSVAPRWRGSPLNAFFVCDLEHLIEERQPALWVHGHTHDSCDYTIGKTRVVCNPFGYVGVELNQRFDPHFTVEVT